MHRPRERNWSMWQTSIPDLDQTRRSFPTPFSMNPDNVSAYSVQWNVNVQRTFGRKYLVEVAYTGSQSRQRAQALQLNQPREGTAPIRRSASRIRSSRPRFSRRAIAGHGDFKGVSVRLDKRFSGGLFFTGSYQLSKNQDNNSGEIEANDTAFAWDHEADRATRDTTSRTAARSVTDMNCPSVRETLAVEQRSRGRMCSEGGRFRAWRDSRAASPSRSRPPTCVSAARSSLSA